MQTRCILTAHVGAIVFFGLAISPAAADCGPTDSPERASYRALSWDDFRGPRPKGARPSGDPTEPSILIRTSLRIDDLPVASERLAPGTWSARAPHPCVRAYVLKHESGRPRRAVPAWLLDHEQGHFDLTQLHALRLRERLVALTEAAATPEAAERALRATASRIYRAAMAELQAAHDDYDQYTRHGNHHQRQTSWEHRVARETMAREGRLSAASTLHDTPGSGPLGSASQPTTLDPEARLQ